MFSPKLRLSLYVCLVCLLLLSTALAQTPPTTVTFNTQTYTTGASPTGVVSGDFNEDGKPDLAVIDNNSNSVQILLGVGAGLFTMAGQNNTGMNPVQIVTGKFNLSSHQDLAIANAGDRSMTILLGKGDGTFTARAFTLVGVPTALMAADFLNNGRTQLAVVECASQTMGPCSLNIYQSDANALFTHSQQIPLPGQFAAGFMVSDDFNHHHMPDLAVATATQVLVFANTSSFNGTGTATVALRTTITPPNTAGISGLAAGHFVKGNPTPDLAIEVFDNVNDTSFPNTCYIFLNNGFGSFFLKSKVVTEGFGNILAVADINGDGNQDLLLAGVSFHNGDFQYALGHGDGTFGPLKIVGGIGPNTGIIARDLALDSRHSVVMTAGGEFGTPGAAVLLNQNALTNCPPPGSAKLGVKVCSITTAINQISIQASGNSPNGVKRVELWVDGVKRTQNFSDQLRATVGATPGTHRVTVVGVDLYDALIKQTTFVSVP
jgi:hypothetical protein